MPGLMTWSEYESGLKTGSDTGFKSEVKKGLKEGRSRKAPAPSILYTLMYPENTKDSGHNGTYKVEADGIVHNLEIINGLIQTDNDKVKDILAKQGFIFIKEEKNNGDL